MSKIIFSESGSGLPVIFLHGYGENKLLWTSFEEKLSSNFRVIVPDLPGFGQSEWDKTEFSLEDVADELYQWLQEIKVASCIMIGHSLGGYIALAYARKYKDHLKGLGLFHSSIFEDTAEKKENRSKTIEFIKKNGSAPFMENFVPNLFYKPRQEEIADIIQKQVEIGISNSADTLARYMAAMRDRKDSSSFIKEFDQPVLMIIGQNDQSVPFEKSQEQAAMLKHPTVHILNETGHMGMFERETETLKYVEAFCLSLNQEN
ncbi:MAG: alpha/beta fold hydrolase [Candidatus Cyclobacteriaceae bacterium M3_2C_046]